VIGDSTWPLARRGIAGGDASGGIGNKRGNGGSDEVGASRGGVERPVPKIVANVGATFGKFMAGKAGEEIRGIGALLVETDGAVLGRLMPNSRTLVLVVLWRESTGEMPVSAGRRDCRWESLDRGPVSARIAGSELRGACVNCGHHAGVGRAGMSFAVLGLSWFDNLCGLSGIAGQFAL
jgi:hypothetical protein